MISRFELRVQESEIDELGHVNNARFLEYFEHGRLDWYNRCDPTLNNIADHSLGTVVVNIDINYRRECFCGAQLSVITRPWSRGRTSYVLHQEIHDHGRPMRLRRKGYQRGHGHEHAQDRFSAGIAVGSVRSRS